MKLQCLKCGCVIDYKDYTDLYRIESHHVHPKFMDNPDGNGRQITLCRDCHIINLHIKIRIVIKKYSNNLKVNDDVWLWKFVPYWNKEECINEVIQFTENWLKEENGDTKTITRF